MNQEKNIRVLENKINDLTGKIINYEEKGISTQKINKLIQKKEIYELQLQKMI